MLWLVAAVAMAAAVVAELRPGAAPGFGMQQTLLTLLAFAATAGAIEVQRTDALLARPVLSSERRTALGRFALVTLQLILLVLVVRSFRIESTAYYERIIVLTAAGFVIHDMLPMRMRLLFFVVLSFAGIYLVFGLASSTWLIGFGLLLIAMCHLPIAFRTRVGLLMGTGFMLGLLRAEILPAPVPGAIWTILGSMFMFRLIVYMYDLRHAREPFDWKRTLAYFFMLPNVVFPLFPVVDWTMFRRTYYDEERYWIYQRGVQWMTRGITHLLLYRIIDYYVALSPADVQSTADLVQFMVSTYLLYLRVSGQFHLIVGMLHLFGFRLPETHHLFYLASSFTDFWRRINIYWKDFMMKVVYYPTFFATRRLGTLQGIVLATLAVFLATWALHAYQWFWLLGTLLLTWPDVLFWTVLALLMIVNAIIETKRGRARTISSSTWTATGIARRAVQTLAFFAFMCILWSFWSSDSVGQFLGLWSVIGGGEQVSAQNPVGPLLALSAFLVLRWPEWVLRRRSPRRRSFVRTAVLTLVALAAALVLAQLAQRGHHRMLSAPAGEIVAPSPAAQNIATDLEVR